MSQQSVSVPSLSTENEKSQLLGEENRCTRWTSHWRAIHQWFESQAAQVPEHVALVFDEQELTYSQLNRQANQLAHYLRSHPIQPDTLIGLCIERSLEMFIGILGILKAGGAYVPLDPAYPKERVAFMLNDSAVSIVLTQHESYTLLGISRVERNIPKSV